MLKKVGWVQPGDTPDCIRYMENCSQDASKRMHSHLPRMGAKQIVLVGDHCQLGPVSTWSVAAFSSLANTLVVRTLLCDILIFWFWWIFWCSLFFTEVSTFAGRMCCWSCTALQRRSSCARRPPRLDQWMLYITWQGIPGQTETEQFEAFHVSFMWGWLASEPFRAPDLFGHSTGAIGGAVVRAGLKIAYTYKMLKCWRAACTASFWFKVSWSLRLN